MLNYVLGQLMMAGSTPVAVSGDSGESSAPGSQTQEPSAPPVESSTTLGKEKTPMCLVNELARYNKVDFLYCTYLIYILVI